jgi:hypothetical protein
VASERTLVFCSWLEALFSSCTAPCFTAPEHVSLYCAGCPGITFCSAAIGPGTAGVSGATCFCARKKCTWLKALFRPCTAPVRGLVARPCCRVSGTVGAASGVFSYQGRIAGRDGTTAVRGWEVRSEVRKRSWLKVVSKSCSLPVPLRAALSRHVALSTGRSSLTGEGGVAPGQCSLSTDSGRRGAGLEGGERWSRGCGAKAVGRVGSGLVFNRFSQPDPHGIGLPCTFCHLRPVLCMMDPVGQLREPPLAHSASRRPVDCRGLP